MDVSSRGKTGEGEKQEGGGKKMWKANRCTAEPVLAIDIADEIEIRQQYSPGRRSLVGGYIFEQHPKQNAGCNLGRETQMALRDVESVASALAPAARKNRGEKIERNTTDRGRERNGE